MSLPACVDVLVAGLGPAGGAAAHTAAAAGCTVLAVERSQQVGVPVQCAEFLPRALGRHAQAAGVLRQRLTGMTTHLPSGAGERSALPGLMIDRAAFDQALAQRAQEQGAELWLGARLTRLDAAGGRAWMSTGAGEREVAYRVLIAADGPNSSVAASLGLAPLAAIFSRQYTVRLRKSLDETQVWLSPDFPGGYAWLFPKGELANLGAGADRALTHDLKRPLDALHRSLVVDGCVEADILNTTGGLIPVGGLREPLRVGSILFAGDAAGLTHPISGAGIAAALDSGALAGEAAAHFVRDERAQALAGYVDEIHARYGPSLRRAMHARRQFAAGAAMDDAHYRRAWIAFPEYYAEPITPAACA